MKTMIIAMIVFISSSVYAQESIKVIGLKNTDAKAVAETLQNVIEVVNKDDKDKQRTSLDKMAAVMFKRIDADKNGSLSLKEFQTFYARIRSSRQDHSGRSDRDSSRRGPQGFGQDKQRDSKGGSKFERPDKGGFKSHPQGSRRDGPKGKGKPKRHDK